MTLKEELIKSRTQATTVTEDELKNVVEKAQNVYRQMHKRDVDKFTLSIQAKWEADKLTLTTQEEAVEKIPITNVISSKKKQKEMQEKVEEKLKEQGVITKREEEIAIWSLHLS